jgi:oligoribonuclease
VRELRYYRDAVFVPQPGPDSATAREIAARYASPPPGTANGAAGSANGTAGSANGTAGSKAGG